MTTTALQVSLGSIDFNTETPDSDGNLWYITEEIEGWDSPAQRLSELTIPTRHGGKTTQNLYAARSLLLKGLCKASTLNNYYEAKYHLQAVTNALRVPILLKVTEDVQRRMSVIRSGQVRTAQAGMRAFTFEVNLRADDPFKYSEVLHSANLVANVGQTIANAGSVRTYPTAELNDSVSSTWAVVNYELGDGTVGPGTWRTTHPHPSGTVVDMDAVTAYAGTGDSMFAFVRSDADWWWLEPGDNLVQSDHATIIRWRDAWV